MNSGELSPYGGWGFDSRQEQDFPILHSVPAGSGAHTAPCPLVRWAISAGVKRPGYEADYSPPYTAEIKNSGVVTPLPRVSLLNSA